MVNEVAVISGKGGTGKTTVCAALGVFADEIVMADCDVDAPDLHILLHPSIKTTTEFVGSKVAVIDEDLCTECGLCDERWRGLQAGRTGSGALSYRTGSQASQNSSVLSAR